ncbi:hypothetical protein K491DRAFT_735722 [Lophiostoma macrostomum CBS 122681]|uniref:Uncharacterized protein n=1 Tax=Lophiostoma macrostomum CBS 122681 TaxID=1314788 RepID=A0A6A6SQ55_9PLEO|nr:hypothetical protein K491DRAFT_735722 [Lophiostoma macrostomum CBS 122681]
MSKEKFQLSSNDSKAFETQSEFPNPTSRSSFEIVPEPFDAQHPLYPNEPPPPYISNLSNPPSQLSNRRRRRIVILICAILCFLMFIGFIAGMSVTFARKHSHDSGGSASSTVPTYTVMTTTSTTSHTLGPKITKAPKDPVPGKGPPTTRQIVTSTMSLSQKSSVDTILTMDLSDTHHKIPVQATGQTPADYIDPSHPHNGDIESQAPTSARHCISKRMAWVLLLTTLFLATLATAAGVGYIYGERHPNIGPKPEPAFVTLQASTTTEVDVVIRTMVPSSQAPPPNRTSVPSSVSM